MQWSIEKIRLELKYTWKISRNSSDYKENFIVSCNYQGVKGIGEVAPNIRYQETPENIQSNFELVLPLLEKVSEDPIEFEKWLYEAQIPNALKFGIESAYLHAFCSRKGIDLNSFLKLPLPDSVNSCYTLPIMDPADIPAFYSEHRLQRFKHIKVKVNNADAFDMLKVAHELGSQPLMVDANEAWKDVDALIAFMEKLKPFPIAFIEQPLPADKVEEYLYLKPKSLFPLMGDESVLSHPDMPMLSKQFHGINMKLMKAGGYLNGIRILREAQALGLQTMIGCMVETTLGISGAWRLCSLAQFADLDGCLIVDPEPFKLLREEQGAFYLNQ